MKKLILLVFFCNSIWAMKEYYSLSRSYRALGMGGAFYGLSDDEYALFYNPAGLTSYKESWQLMAHLDGQCSLDALSGVPTVAGMFDSSKTFNDVVTAIGQLQGKPIYIQTGVLAFYRRRNWAVGLLLFDTKADFAFLGKEFDTSLDLTAISDSGLFWGYSAPMLNGNFRLGTNFKAVLRAGGTKAYSLLDSAEGAKFNADPQTMGGAGLGLDVDIGAIYLFPRLLGKLTRVGLTLSNLVGTNFPYLRVGSAPPPLARTLGLGVATTFSGWRFIDEFTVVLDVADIPLGGQPLEDLGGRTGSWSKHIHIGLEMPMHGWFFVRTGLHQGYPTAGLGIKTHHIKLDLTYYTEELGIGTGRINSPRLALRLSAGWESPREPREILPTERRVVPLPSKGVPSKNEHKVWREIPKIVR
ncbi:MAG: hypothetical protein HY537_08360 [Deltaproteobacteria bacterium]|nr:hypothetical protein [Deltaproteobacteria bacterium]